MLIAKLYSAAKAVHPLIGKETTVTIESNDQYLWMRPEEAA